MLDLQQQWPLTLLHKLAPVNEDKDLDYVPCNLILCRRLLRDGRFAFEMFRLWGDLRKLLDLRMQHNGNQYPPLMMPDGNYHECCMLRIMLDTVKGMRNLHDEGTLHRDLKASNVLIECSNYGKHGIRFDPIEWKHDFTRVATDFECPIRFVGTGYWRAPEILEALKNGTVHTKPNLLTSDVYSYATTCYDILTGCIPFDEDQGIVE